LGRLTGVFYGYYWFEYAFIGYKMIDVNKNELLEQTLNSIKYVQKAAKQHIFLKTYKQNSEIPGITLKYGGYCERNVTVKDGNKPVITFHTVHGTQLRGVEVEIEGNFVYLESKELLEELENLIQILKDYNEKHSQLAVLKHLKTFNLFCAAQPDFPEDIDFTNTESLGMQIVVSLVEQIEGRIELKRDNGTEFKIMFKELSYKRRDY